MQKVRDKNYVRKCMTDMSLSITVILAVLLFSNNVIAAKPIEIGPSDTQLIIDTGVSYVKEVDQVSIDEIVRLDEREWKTIEGPINFGYTEDPYWFRFDVVNTGDEVIDRMLQINYPLLDHVGVYVYSGDRLSIAYATGDALPFRFRPIEHRYFTFPMIFESRKSHRVYIRVHTLGAVQVPLTLWDERSLHASDTFETLINALYCGVLLAMALFNLLLYFVLKDRSYLFYVFFVSSTLVLMVGIYGYGFQYIYPDYPKLHGLLVLLMVPIAQISICLFAIEFLQLSRTSLVWYRVFLGFILVGVLCFFGGMILPYGVSTRFSVVMTLPITISAMMAGIQLWREGEQSAKLFAIAWAAFLAGAAVIVVSRLGLVPPTFILEQAMPIGTTVQTLLFTLALASRFISEREARMKAQQEHLEEIGKRREAETQILYVANHHELTGLPNRMLFEKAIRPYIENCSTEDKSLAVILLHIRRFDDVNKTLGHRNADILLHRIGERIDGVLRKTDSCVPLDTKERGHVYTAHVEGVSFCFAMMNDSREKAMVEIESCLKSMTVPIEFMGLSLEPSFMVGCSFSQGKSTDPQSLLRESFIAFDMANSKLSPIAIYEPEMNPYSPKRLTLMTELRSALEYDGLNLFFQPQIELATKRICGFEALLRWTHHEYGFVPPDEFIPMAEKTGLMKPLTRWVIKRAMSFCKQLDSVGCTALVSVNISALNLREPDFCESAKEIISQVGVDPKRLVLEVTETAAMSDPEAALYTLNQLHAAGFRLSMDDFGTGHSSLSYIRRLPMHEIKIDRSFVGEMHQNKGDETIVRTTVNMCHDLGYEVVAEGVENQGTVEILQQINCDIIQGYHIAKPMERFDAIDWLKNSDWNR